MAEISACVRLAMSLQDTGGPGERGGQRRQLLLGGLEIAGIDGLVDPRNHVGGISGVAAGGIDGVPEPGTPGQAVGQKQGALRFPQGAVHRGGLGGIPGLLPGNGGARAGKALRGF